jgi:hypothetical protein
MPYHRFKVGQTVVAPSGVRDALIPRGPYVIVRLLPPMDDEPHYHVKSAADGHERALLESQIRPVTPEPAPLVGPSAAKFARMKAVRGRR